MSDNERPAPWEGFVKHEGLMTGDGREMPGGTIDLTLLDNRDLLTSNRKILLVEYLDPDREIVCTFEFPFDAAIRNPDGMQAVTAAIVEFVRGAV